MEDDAPRTPHDGVATRVLFVSTSFPATFDDWRGLFMRHLVDALGRRDDVNLSVWAPRGKTGPGVHFDLVPEEAQWLSRLADAGGIAHLLRQNAARGVLSVASLLRLLHRAYRRSTAADVFHVNWLQNTLALPKGRTPVLATALGTDMQLLRLPGMRSLLRGRFRGRRVVLCPNAEWMVPELTAAFGDLAQVIHVPFGIDPRWYAMERRLDDGSIPKWLCVSRLTKNKLGPLFEWTAPYFARAGAELHLFGPMQESLELPAWVHWHGPASPDALRETWFPQAHGLITLSQHAEGRPQVMLEALASGLPIIASRLPAHDDLLSDGRGGLLCPDAASTLSALATLADLASNHALGQQGRASVRNSIGTWDDCAARYSALYRMLQGATRN